MTIIAKPVIDKKFWILQKDNEKVGNIEACDGGYQVKINNQVAQFKSIKLAARTVNIEFAPAVKKTVPKIAVGHVHGYPVAGRIYNPMWDVSQQLPVYTKTNKSKSWFAAGWYKIKINNHWITEFCPKLILLQRYEYMGPAKSQDGFTYE